MGDLLRAGSILAEEAAEPSILGFWAYVLALIAILFLFASFAKKDFGNRVFTKWPAQWAEQLYLFIENMCVGVIGGHGRKYVPYIMTFWMVIFVGNVMGLFLPFTPTADLSFNLGLALVGVAYVQIQGAKQNGVLGHLKHFTGPKFTGIMILFNVLIFGIEIISELMKNVSLSLRLYGNIHGGHAAVESMNNLGLKFFVPFGDFLLPIKLLTCLVQAMVFTLLNCVYISLVTHDDSHGHEEHGEEHQAHGVATASA